MKAAIGSMLEVKRGATLNMASLAATVGLSDRFGYSMTEVTVPSMTL
jgi:2-keto-3-deoxy-L-fuconate dehydrogenase